VCFMCVMCVCYVCGVCVMCVLCGVCVLCVCVICGVCVICWSIFWVYAQEWYSWLGKKVLNWSLAEASHRGEARTPTLLTA